MKNLQALGRLSKATALAAALACVGSAHAHRGWMLPSSTVLSGNEPWVTVDAAISNDVFIFDHNAMRLDALSVIAPDGSIVKSENQSTGRFRSSFDVRLAQKGTYKISMVSDAMMASYKIATETKRARGTAETLAKEIPTGATDLNVVHSMSRNEVFITSGKPSADVLKPTGRGLELVPLTHPNDLVVGDTARFRFVMDGQPAAGVIVTLVPGGSRYRNKTEEQKFVADAQGEVSISWPRPGMYWLSAAPEREAGVQGGTLAKPVHRASYATTLEVLPP